MRLLLAGSMLAALALAGCALERGGIEPDPHADAGPPPDARTGEGDARVDPAPCVPSAELCDGIDNDCDPATADGADEPTLGEPCDGDDADLCEEGTVACIDGALGCADDGDQPDERELCDGIDNDCNPETGDGTGDPDAGSACDDAADLDLCADGVRVCVGGAFACQGDGGDDADEVEICDGIDNDCNPDTEDGAADPSLGVACDDPLDADLCAEGSFACVGGALVCAGDDGDGPDEIELCDGIDNDCDPSTEDGAADPAVGAPCDDPGDADLCPEGTRVCSGGALICTGDDGDQPGEVELCDGVDNDCNPLTLDGAAQIGTACDGSDGDLCAEGVVIACSSSGPVCDDMTGTNTETCNGRDDDCDGTIDEGAGCPCTRVANGPRSYLFCNTTDDWRDARDFCAARGYYLVKIEDAAEQAFVTTTAGAISGEAWWIGLNDRASEGMYVWTDGTPLGAYTAWEPGQPNDSTVGGEQDCVALEIPNPSRGEPGGWNDYGCGVQARFICEAGP